ncbi:MAG: SDR family oxidoreductase [Fibrobacterota bacterium]
MGEKVCREALRDERFSSVLGTFLTNSPVAAPYETAYCDLNSQMQVCALIEHFRPDAVIHCAAMSSPDMCEKNPAAARRIVFDATCFLAKLCRQRSIKLVFVSSDMVFGGTDAPYREEDPVSPVNLYGRLKAEGERGVLNECSENLVCRLPLLFGAGSGFSKSFIQGWLEALRAGGEVKAFYDEFRTPVEVTRAASGMLAFCSERTGVFHLGGRERISRYGFCLRLAQVFGFEKGLIRASSQRDVVTPAKRPADVSFDSTKAFGCGYDPGTLTECLEEIRDRCGE